MNVAIYLASLKPPFEYGVQFWSPQYEKHVEVLQSNYGTQSNRLDDMFCEVTLMTLGLPSSKEAKRPPHCSLQLFEEGSGEGDTSGFFSPVTHDRMQGSGTKLHQGWFRLSIMKNLHSQTMEKAY